MYVNDAYVFELQTHKLRSVGVGSPIIGQLLLEYIF